MKKKYENNPRKKMIQKKRLEPGFGVLFYKASVPAKAEELRNWQIDWKVSLGTLY